MKSVITCDMEGVIQTINKGGEELFGYPKDELIGKKRVSLFSSGEVVIQNVGMWLSSAIKNGEHNTKTYFIRKDGTKFNAAAVKATFDSIVDPETGSQGAVDILGPYKETIVIDDFTAKVVFSPRMYLSFLSPMLSFSIKILIP